MAPTDFLPVADTSFGPDEIIETLVLDLFIIELGPFYLKLVILFGILSYWFSSVSRLPPLAPSKSVDDG